MTRLYLGHEIAGRLGAPGYPAFVSKEVAADRLMETGARARAAEARGDDGLAGKEWRRYRLIKDAARDPDELLAEGIELSRRATELSALSR